jgi:hypothetical protein
MAFPRGHDWFLEMSWQFASLVIGKTSHSKFSEEVPSNPLKLSPYSVIQKECPSLSGFVQRKPPLFP